MKGWLLDTNIISELRKPKCHPNVQSWVENQPPQSLYLSTITIAEIRFGIESVTDEDLQQELNQWLDQTLRPWFNKRMLGTSEDIILCWRKMVEIGRKQGYTFSQPDLFIAAIASVHSLCVVTRNTKDFDRSNIPVFNPFLP
jgi:predicted nucleic acid-binding protein